MITLDGLVANARLKAAISGFQTRMPHAILVEGPKGTGKRTVCALLAQALVCNAQGARPCGVCAHCKKARVGAHPDIAVLDGEKGANALHVDAIRALRADAFIAPNEADCRVFVIARADNMTPAAQNALLKVLEEPPDGVYFLLTCESKARLLDTVLSRVTLLSMEPVGQKDMLSYLRARFPNEEDARLLQAAALADGAIGQAVHALEDEGVLTAYDIADAAANALLSPQEYDLLLALAPLVKNKALFLDVLAFLQQIVLDALRAKAQGMPGDVSETAARCANRLTFVALRAVGEEIRRAQNAQAQNANQALLVTGTAAALKDAAAL